MNTHSFFGIISPNNRQLPKSLTVVLVISRASGNGRESGKGQSPGTGQGVSAPATDRRHDQLHSPQGAGQYYSGGRGPRGRTVPGHRQSPLRQQEQPAQRDTE